MPGRDYPTQPEELTTEWLTEALRSGGAIRDAKITGLVTEPVGVGHRHARRDRPGRADLRP